MAVNFLLKRTSSGDKRPTPAQLDVGELGLNYEAGDPGLFFEDSNGVVRKIGPVTVGGTAPNSSPAGQAGNSTGELWLDNSGGENVLKVYDGTTWQTAAPDDLTAATELSGAVYFNAQAGTALTFGDIVYISGAAGDTPIVGKAQANSSNTMPAYGFAGADIASGSTGKIITFGSIEGDGSTPLDTSGLSVNDVVYVSADTAGGWTTTKPTGESNLLQNIGRIQRVNSQNGVIKVGGAGRASATPNLNEGSIFIGNSSNESSTSSLTAALNTYAGINSSADAVAVTIDSSERLGIGTTTPNAKVDIAGDGANSSRVFIGQSNDTADGADVTGYRSRGTQASPSALQNGDAIFKLFAQSHNGTSYLAAGNMGWAASDGSGNSTFSLKTRSGSAVGDRLTIDSSGDVSLTGSLDVNNELTVGSTSSPFQASAANDVVTKDYADTQYVIQSELATDISTELGLVRTAGSGTNISIGASEIEFYKNIAFQQASDITFIDNDSAALEIADTLGNKYITFDSTDDAEYVEFSKDLKISADSQVQMAGSTTITLLDNDFDALDIKEGNNLYMRFNTTNSGEKLQILKNIYLAAELHLADYLLMDNGNQIRFAELNSQGTSYMAIQGNPFMSGNTVLTLPASDGTADQSIRTDGSGNLEWKDTPTALFGINAHASWDGSAGGSFNWSTDKISEGNITSVTRTGQGAFTVTFDRDFDSANYTVLAQAGDQDYGGVGASPRTVGVTSRSAGSMDVVVERTDDAVNDDCGYIAISVIGTLS